MTKYVNKRCVKCGRYADVPVRQRRCYRPGFGKGSYACWGALVRVVETVKPKEPPTMKPPKRYQDVAAEKLALARKVVAVKQVALQEATRAAARLTKTIRKYEARASYWAKRASLTDAELAQEREARKQQAEARAARKVRRGMKLEETA